MDMLEIGKKGEQAVCDYLVSVGAAVIGRNYHSRYGEIDIIAKDGEYIVFVEVKTRSGTKFANPCEFVDAKKQNKIIKTAMIYMQNKEPDSAVRFDVADVIYSRGEYEINYIKNAFWV